jgi:hypothetical protein
LISDSIPWKEELLRVAQSIERRTTQRRWTERTSFLVERDLMNAGYALRRLNEARKVSDELAAQRITVQRHILVRGPIDIWSRHEFWKHFDMQNPQPVDLSLTDFSNQLIHSWVWSLSATEDAPHGFDGVWVSSDWASKTSLYFISAETLIGVFRAVGLDDVVEVRYLRGSDGVMRVVKATRGNP